MVDLAATPPERAVLRRLAARQAWPTGLFCLLAWLLWDRVASHDLQGILASTRSIPLHSWAAAIGATLASFWAVGRYDLVTHRVLGTKISGQPAIRAGFAAIATAQVTGFGALVGALVRWRMLPDLSLWQSVRMTLWVTVSFMAGLAVVAAAANLLAGADAPAPFWVSGAVLAAAAALCAITLWRPRRLLALELPPIRAQAALLGLVALDTAAAAAALYALLPAEVAPDAVTLYAVFLLALGAGLIGATPGGLGPFEIVCLACLPSVPATDLLAAIAGYRLVYYGLPGAAALIVLLSGPTSGPASDSSAAGLLPVPCSPPPGTPLDRALHAAPHAEAQLILQGDYALLQRHGAPLGLAAETANSLIVLGSAWVRQPDPGQFLRTAAEAARARYLVPCLYKCDARLAAAARRAGWSVARVSQDAWLTPSRFRTQGPAYRQLRRKLRLAEKSGLRAAEAGARLPEAELRDIAAAWQRQRGGARGFSMARFQPRLLDRQRVFLCYDKSRRLVAFATFHQTRHEWSLDQMCQTPETPPGAMHLLIAWAIASARAHGCPRLSLAAMPRLASEMRGLPRPLARRLDSITGAPGLRQFKASFAPNLRPLYIAAPSRPALAVAGLDLVDRITRAGLHDDANGRPSAS